MTSRTHHGSDAPPMEPRGRGGDGPAWERRPDDTAGRVARPVWFVSDLLALRARAWSRLFPFAVEEDVVDRARRRRRPDRPFLLGERGPEIQAWADAMATIARMGTSYADVVEAWAPDHVEGPDGELIDVTSVGGR